MTHEWQPGQIFVFGSNLLGIHGAGAARFALEKCGATWGQERGISGESYALPTCSEPGVGLTLEEVVRHVRMFMFVAMMSPDRTFFLTRVGCGFAGFTDAEIAPLFRPRLSNVIYPPEWDMFR